MKLFMFFLLLFANIALHQSKPLHGDHVTSDVITEEEIGIIREDEQEVNVLHSNSDNKVSA